MNLYKKYIKEHPDIKIVISNLETICSICNKRIKEHVCRKKDSYCVISFCPKCGNYLWIT